MRKSRLILSTGLGLVGAAIGTTMGLAGSALGFFFGAIAGTAVFGIFGVILGWFAARDVEDWVETLDTKRPEIKSRVWRISRVLFRGLYLMFGLIVLTFTKLFGLFRT
jgi:uncharacterized membrane protein required for colicin V production